MQGRGLKQIQIYTRDYAEQVAPYAGAWIETGHMWRQLAFGLVAPYAGAWIETCLCYYINRVNLVAPYAGAWIET